MNSNRIMVFVGLPGSGKGTLSKHCIKNLNCKQLSTGDLCRKHIAEQTEIGKKIDFAIKSGKLVSDSIISEMVFDWLNNSFDSTETFIFDGFPRTVVQAENLHKLLESGFNGRKCSLDIVRLLVPTEVVKERMLDRVICSNKKCQIGYSANKKSPFYPKDGENCDKCGTVLSKRPDDNESSVDVRLKTYQQHEDELLGFFKKAGYGIVDLNGNAPVEEVFNNLGQALDL